MIRDTMTQELSLKERRAVRKLAGAKWASIPIVVVPGRKRPSEEGESWYYTTPSGKTLIRYPGSYKWPKMYHASTRRVEVGERYVKRMREEIRNRKTLEDLLKETQRKLNTNQQEHRR